MIVQPQAKKCNVVRRRRLQASQSSSGYAGVPRKKNPTVLVCPMRKKPFSCAPIHFGVEGGGKPIAGNELRKGIEKLERQSSDSGWIEVITGSMFSGKSEELIRRLRRAQIARQMVQIFKPWIDLRYSDQHIISHSEMKIASQSVKSANEILAAVDIDTNVVGIDEGQFFDQDLVRVANILADQGKRVIVAGLPQRTQIARVLVMSSATANRSGIGSNRRPR